MPVAVPFSSGPAYPSPDQPDKYAAQRAIDGDPQTFCCLLDDTLTGDDGSTMPPRAAAPVTGHIVFDLGGKTRIAGAVLTARHDGGPFNPKQLDFFCYADDDPANNAVADDLEHDGDIRQLLAGQALGPLRAGESATVHWPPVTTRYVGLRVEGSYESGGHHYNFQLGEIEFLVAQLESDVAARAIAESGPAGRLLGEQLAELDSPEVPERRSGVAPVDCQSCRVRAAGAAAGQPAIRRRAPGPRVPSAGCRRAVSRAIRQPPPRAIDQTGLAEPRFEPLAADLELLQHEALVRRNPLLACGKLLFVKRFTYRTGWYYSEFMQAGRAGGNLCVLSLDDGRVTELVPEWKDAIFDRYDLSFDGQRVVFGCRPAPGRPFRLYEVGVDGQGLRQLTDDPPGEAERLASYGLTPGVNELGPWRKHTDDFHPCYLPDGGICFASSRCERGVLCDVADNLSVNVLYRVDGNGGRMTVLSNGALSESTPAVMNDGRILYTRWEYVDKGVIAAQDLWAMRPDGSASGEVYGGHHEFPPVLIHGQPIPGRHDQFVCTATMHHPFAVGPILKIDTSRDIRTVQPIQNLTPDTGLSVEGEPGFPVGECYTHLREGVWVKDNRGPLFCDPYPLSDKFFLVTCNPDQPWNHETAYGLWLIDEFGNRVRIYHDPAISCWQPIPLRSRPVPPVLPAVAAGSAPGHEVLPPKPEALARDSSATLVLSNVYDGLEGVEPGEIRYLRIWEQVPRPWTAHRFWPDDATLGQNAVISMYAHIYVRVLHGIVPVEADGSAHFQVPADRNLFLQAVDKDFLEVQRMRTFVNLRPGESRSCIGCHEPRNQTPSRGVPLALLRAADHPGPQPGETVPRSLYYPTDIQPILDQHCVGCHGGDKTEGGIVLSGEPTTFFNRSYETIMAGKWIAYIQEFVGPQPRAQKTNVTPLPPKALGSHASRLIQLIRAGHYDVTLPQDQWVRLVTWVDANGPYYGSYFGRRNLKYQDLPDFRPVP